MATKGGRPEVVDPGPAPLLDTPDALSLGVEEPQVKIFDPDAGGRIGAVSGGALGKHSRYKRASELGPSLLELVVCAGNQSAESCQMLVRHRLLRPLGIAHVPILADLRRLGEELGRDAALGGALPDTSDSGALGGDLDQ